MSLHVCCGVDGPKVKSMSHTAPHPCLQAMLLVASPLVFGGRFQKPPYQHNCKQAIC